MFLVFNCLSRYSRNDKWFLLFHHHRGDFQSSMGLNGYIHFSPGSHIHNYLLLPLWGIDNRWILKLFLMEYDFENPDLPFWGSLIFYALMCGTIDHFIKLQIVINRFKSWKITYSYFCFLRPFLPVKTETRRNLNQLIIRATTTTMWLWIHHC